MSKYSFDRMSPDEFESMAQALLENSYRIEGNLIQFGAGQDGAREATWSQPLNHPTYKRPINVEGDVPKEWVFQVKCHDIGQRGWTGARDAVVEDLEKELGKIVHKYEVPCHAYVMITNVPFTGARNVGTKDKVKAIAEKWQEQVPEIFVWDAADISKQLDADGSVRTAYLETILPGDILKAIYLGATFQEDRRRSAFLAYLEFVAEREAAARVEEAGDEPGLPLSEVFIDLTLAPSESPYEEVQTIHSEWADASGQDIDQNSSFLPKDVSYIPASFAFLLADYPTVLLLGGPGLGKSTLTQFLALYQAARFVKPELAQQLVRRLKLPTDFDEKDLDASCLLRFPIRVELRRYARWMSETREQGGRGELARYIAEVLINENVSSSLGMDDIFSLAASDPTLLILDGLDEVPHPETRKQILENLQIFLRRVKAENGDIQLLLSSRPKGYSGEFDSFKPLVWELNELQRPEFDEYCTLWIDRRIRDAEERREAKERIDRGMQSNTVSRLAQSLLQATVMLTIVRRKSEIPHQRHELYRKYVEVIFDREKEKGLIVRQRYDELLRLHERVGYELHRKMEQAQIEALDRPSFRSYILNVLEDYSGTDLGEKKIGEVADEIVTAATDRLCLLVGRGKDQAEVDFVVQSFREYFAAVYLFNHPDADADKVFSALVLRGAYWANVLQFYVAQASPNQQMRWVMSADGNNFERNSEEAVVSLTRTRRALLNVFPELDTRRKNDFERALRIVFDEVTRWTWTDQQSGLEVLRILRSGAAWKTLWEQFGDLSTEDVQTLAAELWLLVGLVLKGSDEWVMLHRKLQELLLRDESRSVVLHIIVENGFEINFAGCNFSDLLLERDKRISSAVFECQTKEKRCELLIAGFLNKEERQPLPLEVRGANALLPHGTLSLFDGTLELTLCPYLCRSSGDLDELKGMKDEIAGFGGETESLYSSYFYSLILAAQNPTDIKLDEQARENERRISSEVPERWKTEHVLGPPISLFSSPQEWIGFKSLLKDQTMTDSMWINNIANLGSSLTLWTTLIFHPEEWPLLVQEGLLSQEEWKNLASSPLMAIFSIPKHQPHFLHGTATVKMGQRHKVPLLKILRVVISITENMRSFHMNMNERLFGILFVSEMLHEKVEDAEQVLNRIVNLQHIPDTWISFILRLCLVVKYIDESLLLDFWNNHNVDTPHWAYIREDALSNGFNDLLERVLLGERPSSTYLAAAIAASGRPKPEIQQLLLDRIIEDFSYLQQNRRFISTSVAALHNLRPSIEEFRIWSSPEYLTSIRETRSWRLDPVCARFVAIVNERNSFDSAQLRQQFLHFTSRRNEYPPEIVKAALEAVLKLDEAEAPPLGDDDWQQVLG